MSVASAARTVNGEEASMARAVMGVRGSSGLRGVSMVRYRYEERA